MESLDRPPFPWDGHLLLVHHTEDDRRTGVANWVRYSLGVDAKVFYFESAQAPGEHSLLSLLDAARVDTGDALDRGQIEILRADATLYSASAQLGLVEEALAEGYPSVRLCGEAATAYGVVSPSAHADVERAMDLLCRERPVSALCQYPAGLEAAKLRAAAALHSDGVWTSLLQVKRRSSGIALAGEADASNSAVLRATLWVAAATAGESTLLVNLSSLVFLDVHGARAILEGTADYRGAGGKVRLFGAQRPVERLISLLNLDAAPGVSVEEA